MDLKFKNQASLLLRLLPEIAKEKDFALHGGTAINFFYHDMPRLSVDIDLTYLPFETRAADLYQIRRNLLLIRECLVKTIPNIHVKAPVDVDDDTRTKLIQVINKKLGEKDKIFLISFKEGLSDWNIDAFTDFKRFPAIRWKLQNIQKLKQQNPQKHKIQLEALKRVLFL